MPEIAIIGMAGRFPGANSVAEFWQNQLHGVEAISHFTVEELETPADAAQPGYVRARGVIADVDRFDAEFFSMLPKEAEQTDPQQRLFLECCWETLESAGYDPAAYPGAVGVFAGTSYSSYFLSRVCEQTNFRERYTSQFQTGNYTEMMGNHPDFVATRVAYKLDLRGPAYTLAAGCSTSLIAVCQAAQSLLAGESDMALAGAASITLPQKRGYLYQPGAMGSADGHCRTFDAEAAGTVFGSGVAVVLLKRLADAERDGDTVHAVLRGFALNNDGATKIGYTAPSVEGQARVIAAAHRHAGVRAASIGYVEAHGTATPLGDPIELAALARAFAPADDVAVARDGERAKTCVLGTAKTNVGHLDVAAGITGLIHAAHVVRDGVLPPTLHFRQPTPRFDWAASPFRVNTGRGCWETTEGPRRAGVSAFGVGGTNAHVVIEQPPVSTGSAEEQPCRQAQLLVLSARSPGALAAIRANLATSLRRLPGTSLPDAAWTLQAGRRSFRHRAAFVAASIPGAIEALEALDQPSSMTGVASAGDPPTVCMLFAGQGAQQPAMGQALYAAEPVYREAIDAAAAILTPALGLDLREVLYPGVRDEAADLRLLATSLAQPAIFATEYALAMLWASWGIRPAAMIGHSVGEYVAATLAGVFSLEDALHLIATRGRMMQALPSGAMLSVRLPERELLPLLDGASLAAVNGPSLCVAAGDQEQTARLEARLTAAGIPHKRLHTSHAFHSAMMDPILAPFAQVVGGIALHPPRVPFVSTVSGDWISDAQATDPTYWAEHFRAPVRFSAALARLGETPRILLEAAPGTTLVTLARQQRQAAGPAGAWTIVSSLGPATGTLEEPAAMQRGLGELWVAGVTPDWPGCHPHARRKRIPLPTYPFERKRFWIDLATAQPSLPVPAIAPSAIEEMPLMPIASPTGQDRLSRLKNELTAAIEELSGLALATEDASSTFLELGLDSLFLTQMAQAVQKRYRVRITFRELMSGLDSVAALAAHVDSALPPETAPSPAPAARPAAVTVPAVPAPDEGRANPLQQLFAQQASAMQQLFAQQMAALHPASGQAVASPAAAPLASAVPQPLARSAAPEESSAPRPGALPDKELAVSARLGGSRRAPEAPLTPTQQAAIAKLIESYCQRTAGSKRVTQEQRAVLADPRVVAGFRTQWKELIYPTVVVRSKGAHLWDVDGNQYVDILNGFGPIMLGHRPLFVQRAVEAQLRLGFETGPQTLLAGEVAQKIAAMTGNERVTFCNTGSEAVTAALRIARTVTGRDKVVIFAGDYHGMFDEVLVKGIWKGGQPHALPAAPGIPRAKTENILVLEYGTDESLAWIRAHAEELAAVMVEPVQSRHPALQPVAFLREVRAITEQAGTCFIFDEVVTGFRVHPGGCQALFGIRADLATYGKVLAGGMPVGVLAGKRQYMDALDGGMWAYGDDSFPEVGVTFFAGTFVRHPLAMAACRAVLEHLEESGPALQETLSATTAELAATLNALFAERGVPARVEQFASIFYLAFSPECRFASLFYYSLRGKGVHLLEGFPCFLTTAHAEADIAWIVRAFTEAIEEMQAGELLPAHDTPRTPAVSGINVAASVTYAPASPHRVAPAALTAPLTEAQREVWLAAQHGKQASLAFNESFTLRLKGALDEPRLRAAIAELVARHQSLRVTIAASGETLSSAPTLTLGVPLVDLAPLGGEARDQQFGDLLAHEAHTPFSLESGPLIRMQLVRLGTLEHALIVTAHHIICDGWSVNVLLDELARLYAGETLAPAPSFIEFARSERANSDDQAGAHQAAERYWLGQFAEPATPLDLPLDHPRPALKSYAGATYRTQWSPETARLLRGAGAAQGCTLFVTLLTGFSALLARLSNQGDIVVGVPSAVQAQLEDGALVGHGVNFLPIRTRLAEQEHFGSLLKQTQRTLLDAYEHAGYTYGTLVRALKLTKDVSRLPLLEVQFNLEKFGGKPGFGGVDAQIDARLEAQVEPNAKAAVNFDLFLNIVDSAQGLTLYCDYNTDLFDEATIARWLGHLKTLLHAAAASPVTTLKCLPLLREDERRTLLAASCRTGLADLPAQTACALFEAQCLHRPDATAVTTATRSASYAELDRGAEQVAAYLESLGVRAGDLVGIATERGVPMVEALLGIWKVGAAYVPLDPGYPQARLNMILAETCVPVLITDTASVDKFRETATHLVLLDRDRDEMELATRERRAAVPDQAEALDRLAYVIFTSGSTGRPKGVEVTQRNLANLLVSMQQEPGIEASDTLLAVTTLSFDIAALELYLPLISGATVYLASREVASDARLLRRTLEQHAFTRMQATPATWRMLLDAGWSGDRQLTMLCGGEALPHELAAALVAGGSALWNMYGPTETTVWSAVGRVHAETQTIRLGAPIANTQLYVVSPSEPTQLQPPGVPGELCIAGAGVARGYYKRADLTAERFVPDPFAGIGRMYRTGDLVRRLPDQSIEFLGRLDHQVKVNGFRIELGEIEAALGRQPGVRASIVVAREDRPGDKRLVAYLVAAGEPPTVGELRTALRQALPEFMVPTLYVLLPELPLTPNGKVDRAKLPAPEARLLRRRAVVAPSTATESMLAGIAAEVLAIDPIDTAESLFALGADSIHLFQILARARGAGLDLGLETVLRLKTIQAIAAALDHPQIEELVMVPGVLTPVLQPAGAPPSHPTIRRVPREQYRVVVGSKEAPDGLPAD